MSTTPTLPVAPKQQRRWPRQVAVGAAIIAAFALTTTAPALANTPPPTKVYVSNR